jgi:hypothetical protein
MSDSVPGGVHDAIGDAAQTVANGVQQATDRIQSAVCDGIVETLFVRSRSSPCWLHSGSATSSATLLTKPVHAFRLMATASGDATAA